MAVARLTLPRAEARLLLGSPAVSVRLPRQEARLTLGTPAVSLVLPRQEARIVCRDELAATFTTPTLTAWSLLAEDTVDAIGAPACKVSVVAITTAGSPCRVKLTLRHASATQDYATKYSSPEQNTPHNNSVYVYISTGGDRGLTYDLYWSWTSGNESAGPTLLAAAAVYVPNDGEGDYPAEG